MFGLTREELAAEAHRTGFAGNALEKALRMLDILAALKAHPAYVYLATDFPSFALLPGAATTLG